MSKKKHPEHVNHERWLVSYADFITLLFAFFVVLFASSQSDKKKQTQLAAAMQAAFSPVAIFEPHTKQPALTEGGAAASIAPIAPPVPVSASNSPEHAAKDLRKLLAEQEKSGGLPPGSLTVHTTSEGLVISLEAAGFFASGSAEVQPASLPVLSRVAASLPLGPMRIEGHTDNVPIHSGMFATNWELSSARATTIARYLIEHGKAKPEEMAAAGYAEFHPVATNATEEGRARNRRVDIVLLAHTAPTATPQLRPAPSR